jgi:hypothetical protein
VDELFAAVAVPVFAAGAFWVFAAGAGWAVAGGVCCARAVPSNATAEATAMIEVINVLRIGVLNHI